MTDLGDPRGDTDYALCVYAGTSAATQLLVPASGHWAAVRRGFKYADPTSAADGVFRIALQASTRASAHVLLRARGDNIPSMGLDAPLPTPVVVQLVNSTGACFESGFDGQDVVRNESGIFAARAVAFPRARRPAVGRPACLRHNPSRRHDGGMRTIGALLAGALTAGAVACGNGGTFIVSLNSGVIIADPRCDGAGGDFQLRNQGGLVVLVVITSSTRIFVSSGGTGHCSDLFADATVGVDGRRSGDRIIASSITVE